MSISELGIGILGTHVLWEDVEYEIQKKFGPTAILGPNKSVKLMGEMMGFFSRMCLVFPDWQKPNIEGLPKKFLVKILSKLTMMEQNDSQGELTYMNNEEAAKILDKNLVEFHNTECITYNLIDKYADGRIPVPQIYGSRIFTEENPSKGFLLMEFVEDVVEMSAIDKLSIAEIKQVLRVVASLQAVSFKLDESERKMFRDDVYSSFVGPYFGLVNSGFLKDLTTIAGGYYANKVEELRVFCSKLLSKQNTKELDEYTKEHGMPKIISHDDIWVPNTLWTKNDHGLRLRALLDFQTASLNNPAADLVNTICANLNGKDRRNYEDELIEIFYEYMEEELGGNVPYSLQQLKASYTKFFTICGFETFQCGVSFLEFAQNSLTEEHIHIFTQIPPLDVYRATVKKSYEMRIFGILLVLSSLHFGQCNPIDNGLVDSELIHECISANAVELVVLLDGSGSIGDDTFRKQVEFAMHLAQRLNVSADGNHMALIQYAEAPRMEFALGQHQHPTQLEWAIQRIAFLSGATNTGAALKFALKKGFEGSRNEVPKVLVIVSDGQSQDDVAEAAQLLRSASVTVYAVGVTNLINVHELHQITGNPVRVLTVESFDQLDKSLADSLTWDMCKTEFRPGTPDLVCGPDRIGVRASTKKPFDGVVFVMDHFHDENCRAGPEQFPDPKSIGISIPFNQCNVHRYRSLNPRGIFVEMTVVFMFHSMFMTKVDQMVKVQCFYMEADKHVTVPLSVSMITTQFREKMYEMPVCSYTLRKGAPDGKIVKFATLGESVYHRWECKEPKSEYDTFGMLVHSCYVDNGYGDRVDILNDKGCGIDAVLLSTPDYETSLRVAHRPYHVFKYADRPVLQFQCQITLCIKYDNGCAGITPPTGCPALPGENGAHHHHHGHDPHDHIRRRLIREVSSRGVGTIDVFTGSITIVDAVTKSCQNETTTVLSTIAVTAFTIGNLLLALLTLCIWYNLSRRRKD